MEFLQSRKQNLPATFALFILVVVCMVSCQKIPDKKDYLSDNANFNKMDVYEPILGRTTLTLTQFNGDASTYPLNFSIENMRRADGSPAPELVQETEVQVWKRDYDGKEKSIEEIENKRTWVKKPFLDIRSGSGDFIFWNTSSEVVRTYPDLGYLFDVKVQNKGNSKTFEDFVLRPLQEVPYEPYEFDTRTRKQKEEVRINDKTKIPYRVPFTIHPSFLSNLYYTRDSLFTDTLVSIYFTRNNKSSLNKLTFKFMDEDFNAMDPKKFKPLDFNTLKPIVWDSLVHGFNIKFTPTDLSYDVAYPIPLTTLKTRYANNGKARVAFGYSRRGFGGKTIDASFGLEFSIYQPGDWTIMFFFRRNPLFEDN